MNNNKNSLHLKITTPLGVSFEEDIDEIVIPGSEGYFPFSFPTRALGTRCMGWSDRRIMKRIFFLLLFLVLITCFCKFLFSLPSLFASSFPSPSLGMKYS